MASLTAGTTSSFDTCQTPNPSIGILLPSLRSTLGMSPEPLIGAGPRVSLSINVLRGMSGINLPAAAWLPSLPAREALMERLARLLDEMQVNSVELGGCRKSRPVQYPYLGSLPLDQVLGTQLLQDAVHVHGGKPEHVGEIGLGNRKDELAVEREVHNFELLVNFA